MKKTLLSILAGLAVIGSASADVTVDQRKELCAKHPDKYVWVEKDQFCAPINTCRNADGSETDPVIRDAYCIDIRETLINIGVGDKYISPFMKEMVKHWTDYSTNNALYNYLGRINGDDFMSIQFPGGEYLVVEFTMVPPVVADQKWVLKGLACAAFRHANSHKDPAGNEIICQDVKTKTECQDIADFASLLADELIIADYNGDCTLR